MHNRVSLNPTKDCKCRTYDSMSTFVSTDVARYHPSLTMRACYHISTINNNVYWKSWPWSSTNFNITSRLTAGFFLLYHRFVLKDVKVLHLMTFYGLTWSVFWVIFLLGRQSWTWLSPNTFGVLLRSMRYLHFVFSSGCIQNYRSRDRGCLTETYTAERYAPYNGKSAIGSFSFGCRSTISEKSVCIRIAYILG